MMSVLGCQHKKDLKARKGETVGDLFVETSIFGKEFKGDGTYCVVGPSPYRRTWFASVTVKGGKIHKVA